MANRKEISYGSQGSDVVTLQQMLNNNGYKLDVDGIFGDKTLAAVKEYQKKSGLTVDGIVGVNTWGSLSNNSMTSAPLPANAAGSSVITKPSTTNTANTSDQFSYKEYTPSAAVNLAQSQLNKQSSSKPGEYQASDAVNQAQALLQQQLASKPGAYQASDAVTQAQALLQQQMASKPGAYQSQWQASLDEIMNKILNREEFSYDLNADALYQQYKDQYTMQGQQAMMDTMGQAQAMTGGYGSSYAQSVGQQAYQGYMQQLNNMVPELYQLALDRYNQEGQDMYNQYGLIADRENQDYGRYRDSVADWNTAYDQAYQQYQTERNFDYGQYRDTVADWNTAYDQAYLQYMNERDFDYGKYRDSVSDWNTAYDQAYKKYLDERNFDYSKYSDDRNFQYGQFVDDRNYQYQVDRDAVADQQWQSEFDEAVRQYNQDYNYQVDRDKVADSQWQKEFMEAQRQYNQNYNYQVGRDKVEDAQWDKTFQYQQDRDKVSDSQWEKEFAEAQRQYDQNYNYQVGRDEVEDAQWDKTFQYQQDRDKISDSQWNATMDYQKDRDAVSDSQWQAEFDEAKRQYDQNYGLKTTTSTSTSTKTTDTPKSTEPSKNYDNGTVSTENIKKIQKALGVTADGKWGPESQAAAKKKWGVTSANAAWDAYTPDHTPETANKPQSTKTESTKVNVEADLNTYIANGASKSEINTYLRTAMKEGIITQEQYNKLKAQYAPAGQTY